LGERLKKNRLTTVLVLILFGLALFVLPQIRLRTVSDFTLSVDKTIGKPGDVFSFQGEGYAMDGHVFIYKNDALYKQLRSDSLGKFSFSWEAESRVESYYTKFQARQPVYRGRESNIIVIEIEVESSPPPVEEPPPTDEEPPPTDILGRLQQAWQNFIDWISSLFR